MNFNKFVELANKDYDMLNKTVKRCTELCGVSLSDITYLSYQALKHDIPALIDEGKFNEAIFTILKVRKKNLTFGKILRQNNYLKFSFLLWIQDQYKAINEMERTYLVTPPDPKLVNAGIRELDILGDVNLIDAIAKGDILKWNSIRALPYSMVFDKNLKMTIEGKITKAMAKQNKK